MVVGGHLGGDGAAGVLLQGQFRHLPGALVIDTLAADPGNRLGYMTEETAREFYGEQFDYCWDKR